MPAKSSFNVAVLGTGAIGLDHLSSFESHPAVRLAAVADTSLERAQAAADLHHIPKVSTDYREIIAQRDIDIISIALPNYLHAPVALAALQAGKHVMLDKPMATNARDAERLVTAAKKHRRLLMIGQNNRFTPDVQTLKQLILKGVLGDVYHAKTAWTRRGGIPRIGSWFTQSKYAGGGCTYDIGVHALDRCLFLLGEFDAVAVSGQTYAKFGPRGLGDGTWGKSEIAPGRPFDVEDMSVALIKLRSGRTVLLESSWAAHQPFADFNGTQLFGTEAGALMPNLQLFRKTEHGYAAESVATSTTLVNPNRMSHFVDVLLGKEEPYVKPEESLAVQKILDAIYHSSKTGREVRIK